MMKDFYSEFCVGDKVVIMVTFCLFVEHCVVRKGGEMWCLVWHFLGEEMVMVRKV